MKITKALRGWLIANCSVSKDASESDCQKAAGEAFADGVLTPEIYATMTKDAEADEANRFAVKMDRIADGLEKMLGALTPKEEKKVEEPVEEKAETPPETKEVKTEKKVGTPSKVAKELATADGGDEVEVRVKEAAEQYATTKGGLTYPEGTKMAGQAVMDFNPTEGIARQVESLSQRDKAVVGAFAKYMIQRGITKSSAVAWSSIRDHDKELIQYALKNMDWCGYIPRDGDSPNDSITANVVNRRLSPHEQKAIIDDAVSGGTEAVPIVFDDAMVTSPLLQGQFFPLVNQVPLDKGRRIQGAAAGNPSIEWGGVDDTAVTLFATAAFVTAFDTTIYRGQGSIWVGLDFLSDTPIDFANFLTERYGQAMLHAMDAVVCTGDGTTQPEGIMTKAGTTSVAWGGTTTIGNYESLLFGVHFREYMDARMMNTAVFGGTWTSYARAKAIPVGAADARRLSQTVTMPDYINGPNANQWMGRPFKISDALTNAQLFFAVMGRYRMYRRRGLVIRNSVEGDTLIRRNEMLLVAMFRYGGQLERGACAAITTTAPV